MAGQVSLDALIQGIAGAVIDAQDQIEQHQVANLAGYFDGDHRPKSLLLRLPSLNPDAAPGDEDFYRAPLLSLVPTNQLRIKDVRISFDTNLGEIAQQPPEAAGTAAKAEDWPGADGLPRTTINIDPQAGPAGRGFGAVRVVMRVESCEAPEGAARLLNHLAQTQGVVKTVNVG
ncbi:DUF2589 domain-containing protein [Luteimonas sp. SJ-92]|uniref:DUF2589 domain-containing protein n=1 Tax=Luteimonas salinisoli TaxID=2752307 RepID=A0A853JB98_9GAMM|nr:DUF2589 domain-containing protein [Luteimonas salinisoli]NZA26503.1 DUF2589 domain-containing protein [Luteimonas salinisoli]